MDSPWTRRRFAAALFAGGVAASATRAAEEQKASPESPTPDARQKPVAPESAPRDPAPQIEDLLLLSVLQKYPMPGLNAERMRALRAGIARQLRSGEILRTGLQNSDEPATVFHARRYR